MKKRSLEYFGATLWQEPGPQGGGWDNKWCKGGNVSMFLLQPLEAVFSSRPKTSSFCRWLLPLAQGYSGKEPGPFLVTLSSISSFYMTLVIMVIFGLPPKILHTGDTESLNRCG